MTIREILWAEYGDDDLAFLDPPETFDDCIVGVAERFHDRFVVYSRQRILEKLAEEARESDSDDPETEALEYYEFNIVGGWIGDSTPAFLLVEEPDGSAQLG
jgi:hypothetical protein